MVIKEGYKQTEIGVIPKDWEVKTLGDVLKIKHGRDQKQVQSTNGKYPILGTGGLIGFTDKFLYDKESVLIGRKGTIDKPRYMNTPFWTVDTLFYSEIFKENSAKYLYYNFLMIDWYSYNEASGVPSLNAKTIENISIPIPPLAEQTAIAIALADADAMITGLEKLLTKKRNIKRGAMRQLLQPKEGWEVKKLGEVATIVRGASPRPIEDTKWFDKQSPIGWVRISDVTKSKKVLLETTQKLSDLGVKNSRLVENGNLIMSICATVGRPILTTFDVCIHDGFVVFKNPQVDRQYLYYFLTFIEDNWAKSGQTGSQMNLNTTLINNTEIPFPKSPEEQTRIATILSDMDAELTVLEQKLEKYKK